mmetsp:Transcript_87528/g.267807  ORF Transcript_87528/g.267807 Transcript_87528/m.267807 type:complete len:202 (+) Transcript_87528:2865-3470(+)
MPAGLSFRESNCKNAGSPMVCLPESKPAKRRTVANGPKRISSTSARTARQNAPAPPTASYDLAPRSREQSKSPPWRKPSASAVPFRLCTGPSKVTMITPLASRADTGRGSSNLLQINSPPNSVSFFFSFWPTWYASWPGRSRSDSGIGWASEQLLSSNLHRAPHLCGVYSAGHSDPPSPSVMWKVIDMHLESKLHSFSHSA